jgi:hypothetical protein
MRNFIRNAQLPMQLRYHYFISEKLAISTFFYELESNAIDSLKRQLLCPVFAFGPGIPFI